MPSEQLNLTNIEKQASDPLQVLATQKKVSFDETNLSSHNTNRNKMTSHKIREVELLHDHDHVVDVRRIQNSPMMNEQIEHQEEQQSDNDDDNDDDVDEEGTLTDSPPQAIIEEDDLVVSDAKCYTNIPNQNNNNNNSSSNRSNESDEDSQSSNNTTPNGGVLNPNDEDILSGRGAGVNLHPGNVFFRKLISANKAIYLKADPGEKKRIIRRIVEKAQSHGRFLKQDPTTELWTKITSEEARKKTGQALRENGASVKKQHKAQMMKKYEAQFSNLPTYVALQNQNTTTSSSTGASVSPSSSPSNPNTNPKKRNRDIPLSTLPSSLSSAAPTSSSSAAAAAAQFSTNLLWTRMNMLQEKQEQLKRKQRELEDEQHQLMQCFYQLTAYTAAGVPTTSTSNTSLPTPQTSMDLQRMIPTAMDPSRGNSSSMDRIAQMERFYLMNHQQHQGMMDTASDCDSDPMHSTVLKKRRIIVPNH